MTDKDMLAAAPKPGHYKDALIEELDRCDESPAGAAPLPDDVEAMVERLRTGGETYEELLDLCTRQAANMLERLARELAAMDKSNAAADRRADDLETELAAVTQERDAMSLALQNCRLLAARHRKEDWALLILGFCAEGGVVGSVTR